MLKTGFYFAVGAAGGTMAAVIGWAVFSKMLDKQFNEAAGEFVSRGGTELRRTLDNEIPVRVRQTMDQKLSEVGITRETGRQLSQVLSGAERIGLIGLGRLGPYRPTVVLGSSQPVVRGGR